MVIVWIYTDVYTSDSKKLRDKKLKELDEQGFYAEWADYDGWDGEWYWDTNWPMHVLNRPRLFAAIPGVLVYAHTFVDLWEEQVEAPWEYHAVGVKFASDAAAKAFYDLVDLLAKLKPLPYFIQEPYWNMTKKIKKFLKEWLKEPRAPAALEEWKRLLPWGRYCTRAVLDYETHRIIAVLFELKSATLVEDEKYPDEGIWVQTGTGYASAVYVAFNHADFPDLARRYLP